MAIIRTVWKANLGGGVLSVVREDRKTEILFSLVEDGSTSTPGGRQLSRRLTFTLTDGQAMDLARFLAGIGAASRRDYAEEHTPTTIPGRPEDIEGD
jgi:hypothetical protein